MSGKYNGWTNYETWNVNLWINNEQYSYNYWNETAQEIYDEVKDEKPSYSSQTRLDIAKIRLAERLQEEHEQSLPELSGFAADLLNAALSEVNWYDIAAGLLEEVEKEEEEEEETEEAEAK